MLLVSYFFFTISVVIGHVTRIDDYVVKINNDGNLEAVEWTENFSKELNLSNLNITSISANAFSSNLSILEILHLSQNKLHDLPEMVFSNLTNLRNLSLANNQLLRVGRAFVGLEKLAYLDLTNNLLYEIRKPDSLFGLNKLCVIAVSGNAILSIGSEIFNDHRIANRPSLVGQVNYADNQEQFYSKTNITIKSGRDWSQVQFIVCIKDNVSVKRVGFLMTNENLSPGCKIAYVYPRAQGNENTPNKPVLYLNKMGIERFERGWYHLEDYPLHGISLEHNKIANLTDEILNELPENVKIVDLSYNKIETLKNCTIENEHLWELRINENSISHIDDGTFARTKLKILYLKWNRLHSTKFARTLPTTLTEFHLLNNEITNIMDDSFKNLERLIILVLDANNITEISERAFRGLSALKTLRMSRSNVKTIAPGAFRDLTGLQSLELSDNKIEIFEEGVFEGLDNLRSLYLDYNRLQKISNNIFRNMNNLRVLSLVHNRISCLESTDESATNKSSTENEKSYVFDLPKLESLNLCANELIEIKAEYFEGLKNLRSLSICSNAIAKIGKILASTMPKLRILDLYNNCMVSLDPETFVHLSIEQLSLKYNRISIIANGTFQLPNLLSLDLSGNKLSHLDAETFANLRNLEHLYLADNVIPEIHRGTFKYFHKLSHLDLSRNAFEILENGALCGFQEDLSGSNYVDVTGVPLKIIKAGLFSVSYCSIVSQ